MEDLPAIGSKIAAFLLDWLDQFSEPFSATRSWARARSSDFKWASNASSVWASVASDFNVSLATATLISLGAKARLVSTVTTLPRICTKPPST